MNKTEEKLTKTLLAGADTGEYDVEISMAELEELAQTAGAEVMASVIQKRNSLDTATCLGEGKIEEIKELCQNLEVELVIFDHELTASQIRNIEKIVDCPVIDRTMLILDIFASRAVSGEGKLQVELAQLKYRLPRLAGIGTSLSRLGGGIGTRGPGETQLETDRRHIRRKITKLLSQLEELKDRREVMRKRRKKDSVQVAAIVGYTNVGKSTLLNALTDAGVLAENKLFATLDPTSRGITLPDGRQLLLVDTVGLIRRLPHHLVEAFKSTLEEAANADIILHIQDISDPEVEEKSKVTEGILEELGCGGIPTVNILNKADLIPPQEISSHDTVLISAKTGEGFEEMLDKISKSLPEQLIPMELLFPYDKGGLIAIIRNSGKVLSEEFTEDGIRVQALVDVKNQNQVEDYAV